MEDRKGKLTIEQLVDIGDYLHDASTALLLIDKKTTDSSSETLCCVNGDYNSIVNMITETLKRNNELFAIVSLALLNVSIERMEKNER